MIRKITKPFVFLCNCVKFIIELIKVKNKKKQTIQLENLVLPKDVIGIKFKTTNKPQKNDFEKEFNDLKIRSQKINKNLDLLRSNPIFDNEKLEDHIKQIDKALETPIFLDSSNKTLIEEELKKDYFDFVINRSPSKMKYIIDFCNLIFSKTEDLIEEGNSIKNQIEFDRFSDFLKTHLKEAYSKEKNLYTSMDSEDKTANYSKKLEKKESVPYVEFSDLLKKRKLKSSKFSK